MNSNPIIGAHALTGLVGLPLCIYAGIVGGGAGFMSAVIFTILLYQFLIAMAGGGPAVGIMALLLLFFEWFVLFTVCAILFGQEISLEAASYWEKPFAWGAAIFDNLWDGIIGGDTEKKWLGITQICLEAVGLCVIWGLIHLLGRERE